MKLSKVVHQLILSYKLFNAILCVVLHFIWLIFCMILTVETLDLIEFSAQLVSQMLILFPSKKWFVHSLCKTVNRSFEKYYDLEQEKVEFKLNQLLVLLLKICKV